MSRSSRSSIDPGSILSNACAITVGAHFRQEATDRASLWYGSGVTNRLHVTERRMPVLTQHTQPSASSLLSVPPAETRATVVVPRLPADLVT